MSEEYSRNERLNNDEKPKRKWKRYIISLLFILLVCGAGYAYHIQDKFFSVLNNTFKDVAPSTLREVPIDEHLNKISILILGIDENESRKAEGQTIEESRTDSIILTTINTINERIDLVSIPRDSLTYIAPLKYYDKITHAHAEGGPRISMNAVENLLNVPVDFYIRINFKAFQSVVDKLGGIEVNVPFDMDEQNAEGVENTIHLKKGKHLLNGEQALAFVRSRYYDSDMARGQRQMEAIQAILSKAKSLNNITAVTDLIDIAGKNVTHNLTETQVITLLTHYLKKDFTLETHQIEGYDLYYNGVYYYYPSPSNLFELSTQLRHQLGLSHPHKDELMNVRYSGYIYPLLPDTYQTKVESISEIQEHVVPAYLDIELGAQDIYDNIPEQLNIKQSSKDSEAVSTSQLK